MMMFAKVGLTRVTGYIFRLMATLIEFLQVTFLKTRLMIEHGRKELLFCCFLNAVSDALH